MADEFFDPTVQPLAKITVGAADVLMGGFGVYGQAQDNTLLKWVIFDGDNTKSEFVQTVGATTDWFYSPAMNFKLEHDKTYALGVVSTGGFAWSRDFDPNFGNTFGNVDQGGGVTLLAAEAYADVSLSNLGVARSVGLADSDVDYPGTFRSSIRIFSAGDSGGGPTPPIPEPAEWSMLLAGLLVVAFVANRQRRQPV